MADLTVQQILDAIEKTTSFNGFRQEIMHLQDIMTDTDIAIYVRQKYNTKMKKNPGDKTPYDIRVERQAMKGKTYAEFLESMVLLEEVD